MGGEFSTGEMGNFHPALTGCRSTADCILCRAAGMVSAATHFAPSREQIPGGNGAIRNSHCVLRLIPECQHLFDLIGQSKAGIHCQAPCSLQAA